MLPRFTLRCALAAALLLAACLQCAVGAPRRRASARSKRPLISRADGRGDSSAATRRRFESFLSDAYESDERSESESRSESSSESSESKSARPRSRLRSRSKANSNSRTTGRASSRRRTSQVSSSPAASQSSIRRLEPGARRIDSAESIVKGDRTLARIMAPLERDRGRLESDVRRRSKEIKMEPGSNEVWVSESRARLANDAASGEKVKQFNPEALSPLVDEVLGALVNKNAARPMNMAQLGRPGQGTVGDFVSNFLKNLKIG